MSDPVWRAVLWVERFLPVPRPVSPAPGRSAKTGWWVSLVPLLAAFPSLMSVMMYQRPVLRAMAARNRVLFEQLALVVTGCIILATIGFAVHFGVKAWRNAKGAH